MIVVVRVSVILYNFLVVNYCGGYYVLLVNVCFIVFFIFNLVKVFFKVVDILFEKYCFDEV